MRLASPKAARPATTASCQSCIPAPVLSAAESGPLFPVLPPVYAGEESFDSGGGKTRKKACPGAGTLGQAGARALPRTLYALLYSIASPAPGVNRNSPARGEGR